MHTDIRAEVIVENDDKSDFTVDTNRAIRL